MKTLEQEHEFDHNLPRMATKFEGSPFRLIITSICACMGPLVFGYTIGYSSPAIPGLEKEGILDGKGLTAWFGSLITVGAMIGGPLGGHLIESSGRKRVIQFAAVIFLVSWLTIAHSESVKYLLLARLLCGVASGMITVSAPVYIAEISTSSLRGFLGAGNQLAITVGILVAYFLGMNLRWNHLAFGGAIFSIFTLVVLYFIPETPRWLVMKNRQKDALLSLASLRGPHTNVEEECKDIEDGLETNEVFSYSEFKRPELSRPLFISVVVMIFQQFSGINAVMFYTVSIFKNAGFEQSELATVVIGAVQVVATLISCFLMDRSGRRKLLVIAGSLMSITCATFGYYYYAVKNGTSSASISWLAILSLIMYIIGFSLGWGPIPMLVMSEIFPARARGAASGIAIFANWLCAFIVTKEFIYMQELLGQAGTFWLFGIFCLSGVMFVTRFLPETKGKSLEDIELYFLGRSIMV
ncbi:hypothetical protein FSP39_008433 [Pinctada imbricata]|uniref:Major facilitator superfamily (MFS) profile domain-containing protein n=1 Tax=Pinctada imbricata TaxID=66713 RepID=A0AA89C4Z5_PINIB|nr:hypothetical protein FSP39_008433 [Pinctada imbricata]